MAGEFDKQHKFVGPMSYIVCQTQQDVYTFKNVNCCFYQSQQRNNNDETAERKNKQAKHKMFNVSTKMIYGSHLIAS